jgi:hypothetical protein
MPFLVQIDAYDTVADAVVALRAASVDDPALCHLDGQTWWPVVDRLPTLALDFFGGEFGRVSTPASSISLSVEPWVNFGHYSLPDARIRIWHGDDGANWAGHTLRFDGRVTATSLNDANSAEIGFAVDDKWLGQPMLATYAGTGGIEGRVEQKGAAKPLALGSPLGVAGVLLDPVKSIFQLSAYGLVEGVDVPLERLARQFGSPVADYANYAAIDAATVAAGTWVTSLAIGCVRMGAPPYGRLCFLMRGDKAGPDGWARRPGAIIKRLSELADGLSRTHIASLTALDAARPYDLSVFLGNQTDARSPIQSVAASVNGVAGVSLTGELFAIPVQINAAGLTLKADGSGLPMVAEVKKLGLSAPWWRQAIGAQPFWDVHGQGDYVALDSFLGAIGGVSTTRYPDSPLPDPPIGSLYIDATNKQFRFSGRQVFSDEGDATSDEGLVTSSGYEEIQDQAISTAQATADSKITTFLAETAPTASVLGDLWLKESTGEMRRWDGVAWSETLVDLTQTAQVTASLSGDKIVAADYLAAVSGDNLAALLWSPSVVRGGVSIKGLDEVSYTLAGIYGGTFAVDNTNDSATKGIISISAITANMAGGNLVITVNGIALPALPFKVTKELAAAPTPPSGTDSESWVSGEFIGINTTSYTAVSTIKTLSLVSGQSLYGTAPIDYYVAGYFGASRTMTFKWQYAVAGSGSWNDFGAGIAGSTAFAAISTGYPDYSYEEAIPGSVAVTQTKSGLATGDWDVRLVAICSATGRICTPTGSALMEAKT